MTTEPITAGTAPTEPARASGTAVRRKEDARLLTGRGRYVSDLVLPRMRHVAFVRSTHAHARLRDVDTRAAARMDGVVAIVTGRDDAVARIRIRARSSSASQHDSTIRIPTILPLGFLSPRH